MSKRLLCILFPINKKHTKMKKILILFLSSLVIISCGEKPEKSEKKLLKEQTRTTV